MKQAGSHWRDILNGIFRKPIPHPTLLALPLLCGAMAIFGIISFGSVIHADDDLRFLEGLRQRRLYSLADAYCRERLANSQLTSAQVSRLTAERIRVLIEQSLHSSPEVRTTLSAQASSLARDYLARNKDQPRAIIVRLQDALASLTLGEFARQANEVGGNDAALEEAKKAIRDSVNKLELVERELTALLPRQTRKPAQPDDFTVDELTSLLNHTRHQLALALRTQALCYPESSQDRLAALTLSQEQLGRLRQHLSHEEPLAPRARLDEVIATRLLGKTSEAAEQMQQFNNDLPASVTVELRSAIRAEQLRLLVTAKKWREVEAMIREQQAASAEAGDAEWNFAKLEASIALWRSSDESKNSPNADRWQRLASETIQYLGDVHGVYWRMRGDLLLVHATAGSGRDANLEILSRAADSLYVRGQLDQAIAAYEKAAAQAVSPSDSRRRFDLLFKAALIQQQREEFADASRRLRDLAIADPTANRAAEAHLLAAWNQAQRARREPAAVSEYQSLLQSQREKWATSPHTDQARIWLAALYESQQQWRSAATTAAEVQRSSPHFSTALTTAANNWQKHFASWFVPIDATTPPAAVIEEANSATVWLEQSLHDADGSWRTTWNDAERSAALAAARLSLTFRKEGPAAAEKILRAWLESDRNLPDKFQQEHRLLLALAIAKQPPRSNQELQNLRAQLPAALQKSVDLAQADSLAKSARRADAVAIFRRLATANPQDGTIQTRLAAELLASDDPTAWRQALDQWRLVASRTAPRTPNWFRAKYNVAAAQIKLGEKSSAAQLIRFLLETPPGLEGTEWKPQFEQLLQASQAAP